MHTVRAMVCALAAFLLMSAGLAADRKAQARQQAEHKDAERPQTESEEQRLKALGYELLKPFRDCSECPEMVAIPSGSFDMGSPAAEVGRFGDETPQHRVTLGAAFALGRTEVTQGQWRALMGTDPSQFSACGDACPVERVNWGEAQEYAQRLARKTGKRYRLPTEAEWEYAARAGTTTSFNTGACIDTRAANYDGNYDYGDCHSMTRNFRQRTLPVASFEANRFSLHDMHGNVWEWVDDCWHDDYSGAPSDGTSWSAASCEKRVLRGGSWKVEPRALRSAQRSWEWASGRSSGHGFRVALTLF